MITSQEGRETPSGVIRNLDEGVGVTVIKFTDDTKLDDFREKMRRFYADLDRF